MLFPNFLAMHYTNILQVFLSMEMDSMEHIKKQNKYVLNLFVRFDFVFINFWN